MTNEEKQLLIKDLCARLPYGVKLNFYSKATKENFICTLLGIEPDDDKPIIAKTTDGCFCFTQYHIKPYLRPMSSMTEEERKVYKEISSHLCDEIPARTLIDWFLEHHFDYRGLIEKGLALEAPEGMYNN